jgi:hypothetical protein
VPSDVTAGMREQKDDLGVSLPDGSAPSPLPLSRLGPGIMFGAFLYCGPVPMTEQEIRYAHFRNYSRKCRCDFRNECKRPSAEIILRDEMP